MDAHIWWHECVTIMAELVAVAPGQVDAVGVSGMGTCVLVTDEQMTPLRPAILYGVDTRATAQIEALDAELGRDQVLARCGSALSTQAVGPKLSWIAEHEPEVFARARRLFMPSSWLAYCLTGAYLLDHQSASQASLGPTAWVDRAEPQRANTSAPPSSVSYTHLTLPTNREV